jgi:hypothetical protein
MNIILKELVQMYKKFLFENKGWRVIAASRYCDFKDCQVLPIPDEIFEIISNEYYEKNTIL